MNSARSVRRHALVADDCVSSRLLTRAVLRTFDFTVDCVDHGRPALESTREHPYSVVILDAQMPLTSRREIVAELKGVWTQAWARPRFVVIGGEAEGVDRELWRLCGVTDYLPKPLTIPAFKKCLQNMRPDAIQPPSAPAGASATALVDWAALDMLRSYIRPRDNADQFNRIFIRFVREITDLLESMKADTAPLENDRATLHKLKGLLGFMGMSRAVRFVIEARETGVLRSAEQRRQWIENTGRIVDLGVSEIVTRYSVTA